MGLFYLIVQFAPYVFIALVIGFTIGWIASAPARR